MQEMLIVAFRSAKGCPVAERKATIRRLFLGRELLHQVPGFVGAHAVSSAGEGSKEKQRRQDERAETARGGVSDRRARGAHDGPPPGRHPAAAFRCSLYGATRLRKKPARAFGAAP